MSLSTMFFILYDTKPSLASAIKTTVSAAIILLKSVSQSSFIAHTPGVFSQQRIQPAQFPILYSSALMASASFATISENVLIIKRVIFLHPFKYHFFNCRTQGDVLICEIVPCMNTHCRAWRVLSAPDSDSGGHMPGSLLLLRL